MSDLACRLIATIPDGVPLNRVLARHRDHCLRCQAEGARTTGVTRELSTLGDETLHAPDGLATTVMTRLGLQDGADPRRPVVVRVAVRWGATALVMIATAAAIAAGIVARTRRARIGR